MAILVFLFICLGLAGAQEVSPTVLVGADGAFADCPCVSNASLSQQTYGMGSCKAWDADGSSTALECQHYRQPKWCQSSWCYVDPQQCNRIHHPDLRQSGSIYSTSYTTCGNIDEWELSRREASTILLVGVPEPGLFVSKSPNAHRPNMDVSLKFAHELLVELGLQGSIRHRNISETSNQKYPDSSFSACVHDIAIGNLDVCAGDFWRTPARLSMGVAFIGVFTEDIYLVTPWDAPEEETFWEMLTRPLTPFTWGLWAVILCTFMVASLLFIVLEHGYHGMFDDLKVHEAFCRALYEVFIGFLSGGIAFEPSSIGGRVLALGIGFFIMITIATFTASTATVMIAQARVEPATANLRDALSKGQRVCYDAGAADVLFREYPGLRSLGVMSSASAFDSLLSGDCDSALVPRAELSAAQATHKACGFVVVGLPILSYFTGFYSNYAIGSKLTVAAAALNLDGTWTDLEQDLHQPSICEELSESTRQDRGFEQLTAKQATGSCLLLGLTAAIALALRVVVRILKMDVDMMSCSSSHHLDQSKLESLSVSLRAVNSKLDNLCIHAQHIEDQTQAPDEYQKDERHKSTEIGTTHSGHDDAVEVVAGVIAAMEELGTKLNRDLKAAVGTSVGNRLPSVEAAS